jgi:DNA-3-methyladenine glycosylase I
VSEHPDGRCRCHWCGADPLYVAYHDEEWGVPEYDDRALYEKLVLDGFQAGLAWITILRKREAFRKAFRGFDPEKIARFGEKDVERLMADAGIVRSRAKIEGAIKSARSYLAMQEAGTNFSDFLWDFTDGAPIDNRLAGRHAVQAKTELSEKLSKELKRRGFTFCGPVIVYAFMQAVGMVNDHYVTCFRHAEVGRLAR